MSEGTLEEYFNTQIPPSRGVEIIKFWETLFGLLDELREIHSEGSGYLDITPESIHFVKDISDGDSSLRLELTIADSYVMRMGSVGSTLRERELSDYDSPDTYMEYGHAAGRQEQAFRITSSADIWSLGCIYSEAAIWIADGRAGLTEYRRQRQKEANLASPASPFHDGTQVLQSVLAAHADIEERLRRSDNITKNVLDAMVQEMLWEEDRPSAKALLRKADVLLTKARQKSGIGAGLRSEMIRPGSRHRREYSPPNLPSPTQPLPPLPKRAAPALNSVPVRNRPSEVVSGTSQDRTFKPQTRSPAKGDDPAILKSLSHPELQEDGNNTLQNLGTARGTIRGLPNSDLPYHPSTKEPPVPSRTAHISHSDVHHRPTPNQGRPRALRTQESHKPTTRPTKPQNQNSSQDYDARPPIPDDLPSATRKLFIDTATSQLSLEHRYHDLHDIVPTRAKSTASSHQSSNYSQPVRSPTLENDSFIDALSYIPTADEITQEPKPSKRGIGFSLFPTRSSHEPSVHQKRIHDVSVPKSPSVLSATVAPNLEYISLNTCLEWKKANKKVKKHANVPPLLSATMMEELSRRDHAFIIDDSASMAPVSADVQRAFEALSYLVKGMSTEGTELFFTISYRLISSR
ncbi:hypothetical protein BKA64DRAFT_642452 [Cadophora sp. MPI-SDFR-AT-0126]|nr:hypothetical protein BKA64DRAFT_642452 [Leotiomycetes sp. MPI-SDFR-AT-0126]